MLAPHVMEGNSSTELSYSLSREAKAPILFPEQYLRNSEKNPTTTTEIKGKLSYLVVIAQPFRSAQ